MVNKPYYPPVEIQADMCMYLFMHAVNKKITSNVSLGKTFNDEYNATTGNHRFIKTFAKDDNKAILKARKIMDVSHEFFYQTQKNDRETEMICFLRHLRNTIAHGNIKEDLSGSYFIMEDIDISRSNKLTAFGFLSKQKIYRIIRAYLNII